MNPVREQFRDHPLHTIWVLLMTLTLILMLAMRVPWSL